MKKYWIFLLLIIASFNLNAQNANQSNNGKITGKVIDAVTKAVVDYATIGIYKQGSTSPFNGA
ncbi:MAG: hypothetical protein ABI113_13570, partial [Mucilaginibacter sp.]